MIEIHHVRGKCPAAVLTRTIFEFVNPLTKLIICPPMVLNTLLWMSSVVFSNLLVYLLFVSRLGPILLVVITATGLALAPFLIWTIPYDVAIGVFMSLSAMSSLGVVVSTHLRKLLQHGY